MIIIVGVGNIDKFIFCLGQYIIWYYLSGKLFGNLKSLKAMHPLNLTNLTGGNLPLRK